MWRRDAPASLLVKSDEENSWTSESLTPTGTYELTVEALKPRLMSADSGPLRDVATQLGMNEITVKVAAHRMREKYRKLLLQTISQTVENPDDVKQEIEHLFSALSTK